MASARTQQMQKAMKAGRRAWPYVMMAWERWQKLPPEKRERYLRQARDAVKKARPPGGSSGRFTRKR